MNLRMDADGYGQGIRKEPKGHCDAPAKNTSSPTPKTEPTDPYIVAAQAVATALRPDGVGHELWAEMREWLKEDGFQCAYLAAIEHIEHQRERGFTATNKFTLGRARRAMFRAFKEWKRDRLGHKANELGEQCPACEGDGNYCRWCGAGEAEQQLLSDQRMQSKMDWDAIGDLPLCPKPGLQNDPRHNASDSDQQTEARDWWATVRDNLPQDIYLACVHVFGLDGYDELGWDGAASKLGVCEKTIRRRVERTQRFSD